MRRLALLPLLPLFALTFPPPTWADPDVPEGEVAPWRVEIEEGYHENLRQQRERDRIGGERQTGDEETEAARQRHREEDAEDGRERRHRDEADGSHRQLQALDGVAPQPEWTYGD